MYKVLIFDLDGTLLNTIEDIANSMNQALEEGGFSTNTVDDYISFLGDGAVKLVERAMGSNYDSSLFDSFFSRYLEIYEQRRLECTKEFKDVTSTLLELKKSYKLAVISNKPHRDTCPIVDYYFSGIFDYVSGKKDGVERKPHPESMIEAMEYFNVNAVECVYIGDSHVDYEFAANSGVDCCLFDYGYESKEKFYSLTNCVKLSEFNKLLDVYKN